MWKLISDNSDKSRRVYQNDYGSKCNQSMCYIDKEGNEWWSFDDLLAMPYTRNFAATKVSSLYSLGLSKDDLTSHIDGIKSLLKSDDREKYEKIYANVLDFESKVMNATNAIRQMSSLTCVYFTMGDEAIDSFDGQLQLKKLALLEADPEMHSFFLSRQINLTESYTTRLLALSQIASQQLTENS